MTASIEEPAIAATVGSVTKTSAQCSEVLTQQAGKSRKEKNIENMAMPLMHLE